MRQTNWKEGQPYQHIETKEIEKDGKKLQVYEVVVGTKFTFFT